MPAHLTGTFRARHLLPYWLGIFPLLLLLAFVSACNRTGDGQVPGSNAAASGEMSSGRETPDGFGFVELRSEKYHGSPALEVEFSRPLQHKQDFDALLRFAEDAGNPDSSWMLVNHNGSETVLIYPYVTPGKTYTLIISPELLAADGTRLGEEIRRTVSTGPVKPAAGFASQGSVLPARESRGLPVVAINVPEVDVEFLRVRESELPQFFRRYQRAGQHGSWSLDNNYRENTLVKMADPVYLNRFVLNGEPNQRSLNYLPIQDIRELQQPGLYFAVMKPAGRFPGTFDTTFFTVSDIGLHTRAYKEQLFVHTASLATGAAVRRVELRILDAEGRTIERAQTDALGNALLDYKLNAEHVLIASSGSDVTLLPFNQPALDVSEFTVGGRNQAWFDVFAWSGRDLYRPGETVRISALMRDFDGKPVDAQPVFVRLQQPNGQPFRQTRLEPDDSGYFLFEQLIPSDAMTGNWQLEFRTDPASKEAVQGMRLRIEEFLPERMKLELDSPQATLAPGEALTLQADAAYLYGAPAAGNRFTASLHLSVERHPVASMPGWFFGDPTLQLPASRDIIDTTFPANGQLQQDIELPEEAGTGSPIALHLDGNVHESGGRAISRTLKRVVWPAPALVALRPLFDPADGAPEGGRARFELRRVDAEGNPQPATGLQMTLVQEHRDYHWNWSGGWHYDFITRFENKETRTLDVGHDALVFDVPVRWGRYRIDVLDPATGLTMRYPFRTGWSWNDDNRGLDARPDKVKLELNAASYRAGDTLSVTITPPQPGKGVLLVETDHLLHAQEIEVKGNTTVQIPVTEDWERHDVYITALVFRGGSAPSKITPARAVGIAHVPMDRSARTLAVELSAVAEMRPLQPLAVTVTVPELAGQAAHVVVSAVDQGILNITRFPVPDASAHFFTPRRLATDAYDVYGRVIESFEGGTARLRFGGDMALDTLTLPQVRRPTARVQTVDLFSGPVALDANGRANITLDVPDFNGSLRVSALVYTAERYGKAEAQTQVRAPLLAEPSLPRVLAPGDTSTVTLDVQNFSGQAGRFTVRVEGIGPLSISQSTRQIQLDDNAKTTLSFPLRATEGHAVAQVRVRVEGNGESVDRRYDMPVRATWPQTLRSRTRTLNPLAPVSLGRELADGLMAETVNVRLSVSAVPPIPFAAALQGALKYPYGCVEQTVSKGYATLILDEATSALLGTEGLSAAERQTRMETALARIGSMQSSSGHFGMWGNDHYYSPVLTPYITEFLLDARDAGFAVPDNVLQKALEVLSEDLLAGRPAFYDYAHRDALRFSHRAYSGYVLARVNRAPLGTLRTLYDNDRKHAVSGLPLVQLGLALHLQGDQQRGQAAIAAGFTTEDQRPDWFGDYGSHIRDQALMIALMHERALARPEHSAGVVALGRDLDARARYSAAYGGQLWLSTQEQSALARLGKALLVNTGRKVDGELVIGNERTAVSGRALFAHTFGLDQLRQGVRFVPQGDAPLYVSIDSTGIPRQPPAANDKVVKIERDWFNVDGSPWTPGPLKEGQALIARLTVTSAHFMPDALVTDLLPAGLEIENMNLTDYQQWTNVRIDNVTLAWRQEAADLRHEEFRDDRYVAAVRLDADRPARLFYLVRAVTPGSYRVPPPLAEDMYRPELRGVGRATPATVTVVQP